MAHVVMEPFWGGSIFWDPVGGLGYEARKADCRLLPSWSALQPLLCGQQGWKSSMDGQPL